jgi:hypothetical protein
VKYPRDYLSPKSRHYIAEVLHERAEELKAKARKADNLQGPMLWEQAKDLDRLATELEEM